jgi:hypothetical protein
MKFTQIKTKKTTTRNDKDSNMPYTANAIILATTDEGTYILMLQVVGECVPQPRIRGHTIPRQ